MWRVCSRFFLSTFATAIVTNAIAVYLLHDVDADQSGTLNVAFMGLIFEFLAFGIIAAVTCLLATWIGSKTLNLEIANSNPRLGLVLGVAIILIQYPSEFLVRKVGNPNSADTFLLIYLLLAPVCCAVVILLDVYKRRPAS